MSFPARGRPPTSSNNQHNLRDDKENTIVHDNIKRSILHSPIKRQPATPPLSPRRDMNAFSPSPLRLRIRGGGNDDDESCTGQKIGGDSAATEETGNKDPAADGEEKGNGNQEPSMTPAAVQDSIISCLVISAEDPGAIGVAAGMDDGSLSGAVEKAASGGEKETENNKKEVASKMSGEDVKSAVLAMASDDPGANAVVVEVEKEIQEVQTGSAGAVDTGEEEKGQDHRAVPGNPAGEGGPAGSKYVSPSDALMSPCTQQLNALKAKKISRGSESGVRSLFRDRIGKKEETDKTPDDTGDKED